MLGDGGIDAVVVVGFGGLAADGRLRYRRYTPQFGSRYSVSLVELALLVLVCPLDYATHVIFDIESVCLRVSQHPCGGRPVDGLQMFQA
jgi:hypothetical protein